MMNRSGFAVIEGLDNFCRGCLIQFNDPNELIQYTEKNRRLFLYSTGLQVKRNDQFTFQLCKDCYMNMKMTCKFKKLCRNSDKKFQNFVTLKEAQDGLDFTTFLKNNDDTFRFPYLHMNYSTPAHKKEDDNESTCTSIRNFINDMLPAEDLPNSEARIIREVIEEEVDILDDSLDSHWLQDDMSIDSDFNLDLSLSPFSSPRALPSTPTKCFEQNIVMPMPQIVHKVEAEEKNRELDTIDRNLAAALKDDNVAEYALDELIVSPAYTLGATTPTIKNILFGEHLDEDLEENKSEIDSDLDNNIGKRIIDTVVDENSQPIETTGQCIIEKFENVEGETEIAENFFEETQSQQPNLKLNFYVETGDNDKEPTTDQNTYDNAQLVNVKDENDETKPIGTLYCFDTNDLQCIICQRKMKTFKGLQLHCIAVHSMKLIVQKTPARKMHVCPECGREFNDLSNYRRHLKRHEIKKNLPSEFHCDICKRKFSAKSKIVQHMMAHMRFEKPQKISKKILEIDPKLVCYLCGYASKSHTNLGVHMRRHNKDYSFYCSDCGLGFYRKTDFTLHQRKHNKDNSYECPTCGKKVAYPASLIDHIRNKHTGEKAFKCEICGGKFSRKSALKKHYNTIYCSKKRIGNNENSSSKIVVTETEIVYKKSANEVILGK